MLRLYWIRFCDSMGELLIHKKYDGMLVKSEDWVNRFIESERHQMEVITGLKLKEDPYYRQIPQIDKIGDIAG